MDKVNSNDVSHPSSHGPSSNIKNVLCSHLLSSTPKLLMYYAMRYANVLCTKFVEYVMHQDLWNVLCIGSANVLCNGINESELVSAHHYIISIMPKIQCSFSLSL
jgi:hypothetical protein